MDNEGLKCAIDHILDAQQKGEINEDNVLYIVENINVAGEFLFVCRSSFTKTGTGRLLQEFLLSFIRRVDILVRYPLLACLLAC